MTRIRTYGAIAVSIAIVTGFLAVVLVVLFHPLPAGAESLANVLLGTLAGLAGQVANYWLGSSIGSAVKTEVLAARSSE